MILVTGANGKAASEVVRGLSQSGTPIRAMVRSLATAESIEGPGIEIVQGDLAQTLNHSMNLSLIRLTEVQALRS